MKNKIPDLRRDILAKEGYEENLIENMYVLMKEFGWTLKELNELPIPTMNYLLKMINKRHELEKKAMKKKK